MFSCKYVSGFDVQTQAGIRTGNPSGPLGPIKPGRPSGPLMPCRETHTEFTKLAANVSLTFGELAESTD